MTQNHKTVFVIGPTATGKTRMAVHIANRFDGEIIGADSRQVYQGLDIGTGKDLDEYHAVTPPVQYHLIDVAKPDEDYNLFRFVADARHAMTDIHRRNRLPVVAGGTPLYVKALLENYDIDGGPPNPELRNQLETLDREQLIDKLRRLDPERLEKTDLSQRPRIIRAIEIAMTTADAKTPACTHNIHPLILAPYHPRKTVHKRIEERLDKRLELGLVQEVQSLHAQGLSWERLHYFGLEYRYVAKYLQQQLSHNEMREQLLTRIRRFCKAQDIWYRRFERDGWNIHWIPQGDITQTLELVDAFLDNQHIPEPTFRLDNITYGPRSQ